MRGPFMHLEGKAWRARGHMALVAAALWAGCFGDNGDGTPPVALTVPDEIDGGDVIEVAMTVSSVAGDQMTLAFDAPSGSFAPQTKLGVADADGIATFSSKYQSENRTGEVVLSGSAQTARGVLVASKTASVFETERAGNLIVETLTTTEAARYLVAWPINVVGGGTFRKFVIVAPDGASSSSEALVGLYSSAAVTGAPQGALLRTTATIVAGVNAIPADAIALTPGRYWMVVAYKETPTTARGGAGTTQAGWNLTTFDYAAGLPEVMPTMATSNLGRRNFYIVLRK